MASQSQSFTDLVPRKYQEEVFERAQQENIIAALNTGSGKTLISVLLIKWLTSRPEAPGKVVIFLVPMVALVEQQAEYLSQRMPLRIAGVHGEQAKDLSDRKGWARRFAETDVFVMTAQVFLNILTHSIWSIDKVSLMVFDECHHARKNHPYNGILREYFQVAVGRRPKIFGMTASPVWNIKNPEKAIEALEKNLDARVISVLEHVEELHQYIPKTTELIWEYASPTEEPNFPSPTIYQCLQIIDTAVWDQLDILWSNIETRYHMTLANLGPYSASLFLYSEIQRSLETLLAQNRAQLLHDDGELDAEGVTHPGLVAKRLPEDIHLIIDILHDFDLLFDAQDIIVDLDWCTPKVAALVDILLHYYTPAFQGIIFVQQRQVAFALSRILESTPRLEGKIRCAFLVGQGVDAQGLQNRYQGESRFSNPVKAFRDGKINILIATSVAEEGLDFPACDLVVRFDPLHHMIAYVQSRGRARNKASTFVLMVQEDNVAQIQTFVKLQQKEPELVQVYQTRHLGMDIEEKSDEDDDDDTSVIDLAKRERYVVPSTGAILTYDNSMSLLNYLCSLIPRDAFTPSHAPKYGGDFQATLQLPRALPLLPDDLLYVGPRRQSKKEARRAVSFMAVKRLQELDVFDEYLLPTAKYGDDEEDDTHVRGGFTNAHSHVERLPVISTTVKDPWYIGTKLWLHPILLSGETAAGLVTGTPLRMDNIMINENQVALLPPKLLSFDCDVEHQQRTDMIEFTKRGIWFNNSSRPLPSSLGFYVIPLTSNHQPDFSAMHLLLDNLFGIKDWSQITENDYGKLMIMNLNRIGSMLLLRSIRHDLKPTSQPSSGSREAAHPTYLDYWMYKWSKKTRPAIIPPTGPLLEATNLPRSFMYVHHWDENLQVVQSVSNGALLPQSSCSWIPIPYTVQQVFRILPTLARHLTDYYRAQCARADLGLPHIPTNLLIEALTIPATVLPYDNQRLETLGDAVLQVCTTVHLLNKYPNRHEGQLTTLRKLIVSNRYLRLRALDAGLQHYINSEVGSVNKWRYVLPKQAVPYDDTVGPPSRCVEREYVTRSLQDCMEALLGASYLAGGIPFALQTGAALGLQFGGVIPWNERYNHEYFESDSPIGTLFTKLEISLGYKFRRNDLLVQALTHPSFASSSPSYQRLEFLGDAILDLAVIRYLYDKFPKASSHQLALPRTKAICAPTLANIAVRRLDLHKMLLSNSVSLSLAIESTVPILQPISGEEIVRTGWKHDPPKALSDVFESVIGAVLVDSGYDYEKTAAVVEYVMDDVLEALSPNIGKDPVTEVMEWAAANGCIKIIFEKKAKVTEYWERDGIVVLVHGEPVVGPIVASSLTIAKFLAAERALSILRDNHSDKSLKSLCTCASSTDEAPAIVPPSDLADMDMDVGEMVDKYDVPEAENADEAEVAMIFMQVDEMIINE